MPGQDIATTTGSQALAIAADQTGWTDTQLAALRHIGTEKATAADLDVFFHVCARTGLDPFSRQIYMVEYGGKPTIQTGIDGYRLIARRAADAAGQSYSLEDTLWCGPDGVWRDVWLSPEPPAAARAVVVRAGEPFPHVALFSEYVGTKTIWGKKDGKNVKVGEEVNSMWKGKPAHMLGKCAEAGAYRKAFPQDLGGIYIPEEMDHRTVQGEVVVEQIPAQVDVDPILALIEAATTEDELRALWQQHIPSLPLEARGRVTAAIHEARARLASVIQGEPVDAPDVEDPPE